MIKRLFNQISGPRSLKSNTLIYAIAVLVERSVSFLIIPIITKNLAPIFYGIWTQIIVSSNLLMGVLLLGFATASVKFISSGKNVREKSGIMHSMIFISFITYCAGLIILLAFQKELAGLIFGELKFDQYIFLLALYIFPEMMFELLTSFLRAENNIPRISIYYLIKNIGRVLILGSGVTLFNVSLYDTLFFLIGFQWALILWIYFFDIFRTFGLIFQFNKQKWKEILIFSTPQAVRTTGVFFTKEPMSP